MQHISEVLDILANKSSDGLQKADGQKITQSSQALAVIADHSTQLKKLKINLQEKRFLALKDDPEGQIKLKELVIICFDGQRAYRKDASQLANLSKLMILFLKDYSYEEIEIAFMKFIDGNEDLPTVKDIKELIEATHKPKYTLSKALYQSIQAKWDMWCKIRKEGHNTPAEQEQALAPYKLTDEEKQFNKDYCAALGTNERIPD